VKLLAVLAILGGLFAAVWLFHPSGENHNGSSALTINAGELRSCLARRLRAASSSGEVDTFARDPIRESQVDLHARLNQAGRSIDIWFYVEPTERQAMYEWARFVAADATKLSMSRVRNLIYEHTGLLSEVDYERSLGCVQTLSRLRHHI
jgi:hypothetical protein